MELFRNENYHYFYDFGEQTIFSYLKKKRKYDSFYNHKFQKQFYIIISSYVTSNIQRGYKFIVIT